MLRSLQSWLGRRVDSRAQRRQARRPALEVLEDRTTPSITFSGPGNTGVATLTGTTGDDKFLIQMKSGDTTTIQLSDDGGANFTEAAVADLTQINVNGLQGKDTLTIDVSNGLVAKASGDLPLAFDGGPGVDRLILQGTLPGGGGTSLTETFTAGTTVSSSATMKLDNGTASLTASLTNLSGIQDTVTAQALIINANDKNNLIQIGKGLSVNGTATNVVRGIDINAVSSPHDDEDDQDDEGDDNDDITAQAMLSLTFANKTDVTINGLGGDDMFLFTTSTPAAGLQTLTLDGGDGFDVLAGQKLLNGVTTTLKDIEGLRSGQLELFIAKLYELRLGRNASDNEITGWVNFARGFGLAAAIQGIDQSLEARIFLVRGWYRQFLGREASDDEARNWASAIVGGSLSEELAEASIIGSTEFQLRAQSMFSTGSSDERFLRALYRTLLNRTASDSEINGWLPVLQSQGTTQVALQFLFSAEFRLKLVSSFYTELLHRQDRGESDDGSIGVSSAELEGWAFSSLTTLQIRELFLLSIEFTQSA